MLLQVAHSALLVSIGLSGTATIMTGQAADSRRPHLLLAGASFSGDDSLVAGQEWFGLYRAAGAGYQLRRAIVRVAQVQNGCAATKIVTNDSVPPFFLVSGVSAIHPRPVDTVFSGDRFLYPGEGLSWQLGRRWYRLRALGAVSEAPYNTIFSGYELRLGTSENDYATYQTVARLDFADNTPQVRWAGDLDGDGGLDLLIQLPGGGYSRDFRLYLSSLARAPSLLGEAGRFYIADC